METSILLIETNILLLGSRRIGVCDARLVAHREACIEAHVERLLCSRRKESDRDRDRESL